MAAAAAAVAVALIARRPAVKLFFILLLAPVHSGSYCEGFVNFNRRGAAAAHTHRLV